jgi:hypothetical protein
MSTLHEKRWKTLPVNFGYFKENDPALHKI